MAGVVKGVCNTPLCPHAWWLIPRRRSRGGQAACRLPAGGVAVDAVVAWRGPVEFAQAEAAADPLERNLLANGEALVAHHDHDRQRLGIVRIDASGDLRDLRAWVLQHLMRHP